MFNLEQKATLGDALQASLMLRYNKRKVGRLTLCASASNQGRILSHILTPLEPTRVCARICAHIEGVRAAYARI
jgi:hypothetical protein